MGPSTWTWGLATGRALVPSWKVNGSLGLILLAVHTCSLVLHKLNPICTFPSYKRFLLDSYVPLPGLYYFRDPLPTFLIISHSLWLLLLWVSAKLQKRTPLNFLDMFVALSALHFWQPLWTMCPLGSPVELNPLMGLLDPHDICIPACSIPWAFQLLCLPLAIATRTFQIYLAWAIALSRFLKPPYQWVCPIPLSSSLPSVTLEFWESDSNSINSCLCVQELIKHTQSPVLGLLLVHPGKSFQHF